MIFPAEVLGDLVEEYGERSAAGPWAARRWLAWQVLRSLWPAMRSGLHAHLLGIALPLIALDRLWAFVYSQVPLKAGLGRTSEMLAINVLVCVLCAWIMCRLGPPRTVPAVLAAGVALVFSVGEWPAVYAIGLLCAPVVAHIPTRR